MYNQLGLRQRVFGYPPVSPSLLGDYGGVFEIPIRQVSFFERYLSSARSQTPVWECNGRETQFFCNFVTG